MAKCVKFREIFPALTQSPYRIKERLMLVFPGWFLVRARRQRKARNDTGYVVHTVGVVTFPPLGGFSLAASSEAWRPARCYGSHSLTITPKPRLRSVKHLLAGAAIETLVKRDLINRTRQRQVRLLRLRRSVTLSSLARITWSFRLKFSSPSWLVGAVVYRRKCPPVLAWDLRRDFPAYARRGGELCSCGEGFGIGPLNRAVHCHWRIKKWVKV